MGYSCASPYIVSIFMVQLFFFVLGLRKYHKITQIQINGHFEIVCSQKLIRSLADIAVHICQIKISAGNFFLKRVSEYFFVSGPSN